MQSGLGHFKKRSAALRNRSKTRLLQLKIRVNFPSNRAGPFHTGRLNNQSDWLWLKAKTLGLDETLDQESHGNLLIRYSSLSSI